jgi:hypothetical protein
VGKTTHRGPCVAEPFTNGNESPRLIFAEPMPPAPQDDPLLTLQCFTFGRNPITAVRSAHLHTVRLRDDAGAEASLVR